MTGPLYHYHYTSVEFGSMSQIFDLLMVAKTKKDHNSALIHIKNYIKSMSKVRVNMILPKNFKIISIDKTIAMQEFPSEVYYTINVMEIVE